MLLSRLQHLIREMPLRITVIGAVLLIVGQAIFASIDLWANFAKQGNDDIMRLVVVRDFIAGQGWYDLAQYRVLPPEGMPLHWSRYIDAGIAAIIIPFSYILPMPIAELIGASIWPILIQLTALAVVTVGARRLFGTHAACFAVLCMVLWPVTGGWHAAAGNIDHHNVQMLMMTLMGVCAVWPGRPFAAGAIGGVAAAFSLAVGLETLPFVLGVGVIFLARALLTASASTRTSLLVFCIFLAVGSVVFWVGQTPPVMRSQPMCDRLSTPILAIVWTAAIASTLPLLLRGWVKGAAVHFAITAVISAVGVGLAWPLLSTCLVGPYGDLPQQLQDFISTGVGEALPGRYYFLNYPETSILFILPLTLTPLLTGYFLIKDWRADHVTSVQRTALLGLGFLSLVGFAMMLYQMRATTMAASIIPLLAGYILLRLFSEYLRTREATSAVFALVIATALISPGTVASAVKPILPEGDNSIVSGGGQCRTYESVIALNEVPPGLILNHFNFGPHLLWVTHHDILSAGYHTSAEALSNSVVPYTLEEEPLKDFIREADATHLLLCAGTTYNSAFVTSLANGEEVDWLPRVPLSDEQQVLLEVVLE